MIEYEIDCIIFNPSSNSMPFISPFPTSYLPSKTHLYICKKTTKLKDDN